MNLALLKGIHRSIDYNLENNAILYYNGKYWDSVTYGELNSCLRLIEETFAQIVTEKCSYILLYLKTTWTYPVLILGILKANLGFISVGEEEKDFNDYVTNLKIKYIFSNDDICKTQFLMSNGYLCRKKITIFNEELFLWDTQISSIIIHENRFLYSLKTSGTTGLSKIVQVPQSSIFPNIIDLSNILQITNVDKILFMTPVTFDPSVVELFLAFYNGCTLCILDKQTREDPQKMLDVLFPSTGGCISILQTTPSLFKRWNLTNLREKVLNSNSSLKAIILGGEQFPEIQEILSWNVPQHISLYNIYGITEVSCWASINKVLPSKNSLNHIGEALSETVLKLQNINENNEGELLIGSITRKCLIGNEMLQDIFMDGEVLFRETGDIFKSVDNKLFFVGRKDDIVKRWGTRFSLMEIERTAQEHDNTANCCCIGIQYMNHYKVVLFIVQKVPSSIIAIRKYLKNHLPESARPDLIDVLSSFPLTKHGKICKTTLRNICSDIKLGDRKQVFNELWEMYTDEHEKDINFNSAGGNSFTALQFFNELKLRFSDISDSFLGMLMQSKSKLELQKIICGSYFKDETKVIGQTADRLSSNLSNVLQNDIISSVGERYLKGKVTITNSATKSLQNTIDLKQLKIEFRFKYNLGKCVDASPLGVLLSNKTNLAIVGSHSGHIVVLDINKESEVSKCHLPNIIESSACIADNADVYYIGCYDGCLYCIGTYSGRILWKFTTDDMIKSTAVLYKGNIIFGSYDCFIYCLGHEGNLIWKTKLKSPILTEAIVAGNTLYSATFGSVAALNIESGQLIMETKSLPFFSTPIVNDNKLIVANVKGKVMWLNMTTGIEDNCFSSEDMIFSSLVKVAIDERDEIIIFGCQDSHIYCLKNRQLFWKTLLDSKIVSTPFVEILDYTKPSGFVVCFSSTGKAYILDFTSGEKICDYTLPKEVFSSPIVMKQNIVVGCRDDNVYILKIKGI